MDDLKLKKMDEDGFDIVSFEDTNKEFPHAQVSITSLQYFWIFSFSSGKNFTNWLVKFS